LAHGIQPPYEVFYTHSMLFNSRSAVASIEKVSFILKQISEGHYEKPGGEEEMDDILNNLQNIIVQGAALSRYCWPIRKGHEKRGEQIRNALKVSESSPLFSRDLRNEIEHFDEKLDLYLCNDIAGVILPQYVGTEIGGEDVASHMFRAYFVDTGMFQLLGKAWKVPPIADENCRIHEKLKTYSNKGDRFPRKKSLHNKSLNTDASDAGAG